MFKNVIELSIKKMSSERKLKETLAKKLAKKKIPKKVEHNLEQAENKSEYFKRIKNTENSNNSVKNEEKQASVKLVNKDTKVSKFAEMSENDNIKAALTTETALKRSLRNTKIQSVKDTNIPLSIEIVKTKAVRASKNIKKDKIPIKDEEEPSTSKKIKQELSEKKWQPQNWEIMLENMRNMRSKNKAPVDTMGCHKCADEKADEKTQRFHKLVALMLSSQTKDETTYHAMLRLREHNLTPEVICNMKLNVLENILHPVSFYKNKAKYMQQTSKILVDKYDSDIPNNIKELVALPGVGPKMAHICMATAWQEVTGIGVDVHVHRISNRIGWLPKPTKEPEQTRLALEAWLPQHLWSEVNHLLVGFGQTICMPVKPKCIQCLNSSICPSALSQ